MTIPKQLLQAKLCNKNTCELNQRIDKAIEYIENNDILIMNLTEEGFICGDNELLDILKGSDKE